MENLSTLELTGIISLGVQLIQSIVRVTPTKKDDEVLEKSGPIRKLLWFIFEATRKN